MPIGFGAILVNIPLADMMGKEGFLRFFYDAGVLTEVFPLLIFIGIGAMTDFQPAKTLKSSCWVPPDSSAFFLPCCWRWRWVPHAALGGRDRHPVARVTSPR